MRPSDHLLVLWQWDTAVQASRDAIRAAKVAPTDVWVRLAVEATFAELAAAEAIQDYTGAAAVRPADVARGN